jgi:hypothetical protein
MPSGIYKHKKGGTPGSFKKGHKINLGKKNFLVTIIYNFCYSLI